MRALGLDLGERRIGMALSDSGGVLASPYGVLERSGDPAEDYRALAAIVTEVGAEVVVVGMPLSLSGLPGAAAKAAAEVANALTSLLEVPVESFDERLTTVEAGRRRRERAESALNGRPTVGAAGRRSRSRRAEPHRPGSGGRSGIDSEAAAIMLGAWLDAQTR
jgi:putative holliday junction resolvase